MPKDYITIIQILDTMQPHPQKKFSRATYYQGTISADEMGDYQFVGYGDDLLDISIDGHLLFDGGYRFLSSDPGFHHMYPHIWSTAENKMNSATHKIENEALLRNGKVFHRDAGVFQQMKVLIGDRGGHCGFYLFLQKVDKSYKTEPDGTPILPFFRLNNVVPKMDDGDHPHYEPTGPIWNSLTQASPSL